MVRGRFGRKGERNGGKREKERKKVKDGKDRAHPQEKKAAAEGQRRVWGKIWESLWARS